MNGKRGPDLPWAKTSGLRLANSASRAAITAGVSETKSDTSVSAMAFIERAHCSNDGAVAAAVKDDACDLVGGSHAIDIGCSAP